MFQFSRSYQISVCGSVEFPVHFTACEALFLISCSKDRLCFPNLVSPLLGLARFSLPTIFPAWLIFVSFNLLSVFELSVPASGLRSPARDFPSDGSQLGLHLHRPSHFSSLFPVSVR
jgi:hypothetical protein